MSELWLLAETRDVSRSQELDSFLKHFLFHFIGLSEL